MSVVSPASKFVGSVLLLGIIVAVILIGLLWEVSANKPNQAITVWLVNMGLLLVFSIIVGYIITGLLRGVLIDSRNKISLSRLQTFLWTILILSGFLTAVLINIRRLNPDPLSIELDAQLWALMGISTASLVGSPLIKNNKKNEQTNEAAREKTKALMARQGIDIGNVNAEGQIIVNENPEDARWTDIFKGEENGNAAYLDLGKIQMFFFTLITWFSYAIAFGNEIFNIVRDDSKVISQFPALSSGMVALLGISHAAYLGNKAVTHTPQPPPPAAT